MAVLECVKPGAKLGQMILAIDLTVVGAGDLICIDLPTSAVVKIPLRTSPQLIQNSPLF